MPGNGKRSIVCVDDDPFYCELYRNILEPKGFEVTSAWNPADGRTAVMRAHPVLMLLDVMMPESGGLNDGFALLEALGREGRLNGLPVIMISALGSEEDVRHGLELGAKEYLPKSELTPKRLLELVHKCLGDKE